MIGKLCQPAYQGKVRQTRSRACYEAAVSEPKDIHIEGYEFSPRYTINIPIPAATPPELIMPIAAVMPQMLKGKAAGQKAVIMRIPAIAATPATIAIPPYSLSSDGVIEL